MLLLVRKGYVELFRILNQIGILGHSHFMVQFSRIFYQKQLKLISPQLCMERDLYTQMPGQF